jgi:hypothetical protein
MDRQGVQVGGRITQHWRRLGVILERQDSDVTTFGVQAYVLPTSRAAQVCSGRRPQSRTCDRQSGIATDDQLICKSGGPDGRGAPACRRGGDAADGRRRVGTVELKPRKTQLK